MSGEYFLRFVSIKFFDGVWKMCFVFISSREIMQIFVTYTCLYDEFEGRVKDFIVAKILQWIVALLICCFLILEVS